MTVYTVRTASGQQFRKDFVEADVLTILKHMKNNKSHGSDGYTAEFFIFFFLERYKILHWKNN